VHPDTGLPLQSGESTDGLQLQQKTVLSDPLTPEYCADCTRPVDAEGKTVYEQHTVIPGDNGGDTSGTNSGDSQTSQTTQSQSYQIQSTP